MPMTTCRTLRPSACLAALLACLPAAAIASPLPGACGDGGGLGLVDGRGMAWAPEGMEPAKLAGMDRDKIVAHARKWAAAYRAAGVPRVVLSPLAEAVTSWGAVQASGGTASFDRYDFFVVDAIVEAFEGRAVLVLSSRCAWDHAAGIVPSSNGAFREYVRALVERYDGDVEFGVLAQDSAYPDIDGSGKVTTADWEATDADKKAWAAAHRVGDWMVETEAVADGIPAADYAKVALAAIEAALSASPDVRTWLAPFDATALARADLQARFEGLVPSSTFRGPDVVTLRLPGLDADPTGAAGFEKLRQAKDWFEDAGFAAAQFVPFGVRFRNGGSAITGCPAAQCSGEMQAEQMAKVLAHASSSGAWAVAYDGMFESPASPTGLGLGTLDLDAGTLAPTPALALASALAPALDGSGTASVLFTGVSSTRAVKGTPCDGDPTVVVWYDWTLETGEGQPYGDLLKVVQIDAGSTGHEARLLAPAGVPATVALDGTATVQATFPAGTVREVDGKVEVELGRTPVLLARPSSAVPDAIVPDAGPGEGDVSSSGGGGSKGCAAGAGAASLVPSLLVLGGLAGLLRRRRSSR